ncbi:MAG: magnesium transporter [Desulfurivibrionaceae bacterium]
MKDPKTAIEALDYRFLVDHPGEAAQRLETFQPGEAARLLGRYDLHVVFPVWQDLTMDQKEQVLAYLPDRLVAGLLVEQEPARSVALLTRLEEPLRNHCLNIIDPRLREEMVRQMAYPPSTAGVIMDPGVVSLHGSATAAQGLERLRASRKKRLRHIYLVDKEGRLTGRVNIQDLALARSGQTLAELAVPVEETVADTDQQEEVVEVIERNKEGGLPVVDYAGRLVGVIRQADMITALQQEVVTDIQTMVGVSRNERALSSASFAVTRRLPWLEINLLTAFLAAAVVGIFENTIARFTALAILLPVVAGQSGNAGAQALAVTMRGLALREISVRHWFKVVWKEVRIGFFNSLAVALTTALGVYIWSGSSGLSLVISASMIIAMVAAGFAGATIPIILTRMGQDPAQSSSILLTTVTDVVGFFSFLGIATLLAFLL